MGILLPLAVEGQRDELQLQCSGVERNEELHAPAISQVPGA